MTALPRLLVIMGSGETAPTMKGVHRAVFDRIAAATGGQVDAVLIDTPFGFQENAPTLATKTAEYFMDTAGRHVEVAGLGRTDTGDVVAAETAIARIRAADWVFAGPGSPTFALEQWRGTALPDTLADKLRPGGPGGAVVFSSAAALTLGRVTIPVYEIYKAGRDPFWVDGLDLLTPLGLPVAVVPHYDNKDGGNHDTSKCFLGERRLRIMEAELDADVFVLGVDEHTGVIIDLDARTAEVMGRGGVTLRRDGASVRIEAGTTVALEVLRSGGAEHAAVAVAAAVAEASGGGGAGAGTEDASGSGTDDAPSLRAVTARLEEDFDRALAARDADSAVAAVLTLETSIVEWSRDTLQGDDLDRARAALRAMIVRLGAAATDGVRDVREVLGPVVEAALAARRSARAMQAFEVSDAIRDELAAAGIEVRDTPDGVEWSVTDPSVSGDR
jgi:hypothetical protein